MKTVITKFKAATIQLLFVCLLLLSLSTANAKDQPNIVLVFMDNFGWGEPGFNGGGIIRGAPTPRLDALAAEGMRLTNFNVESQCTPSRAAIMSGRYAIRTGNGTIPLGGGVYGLVQWEVTMAEMLADAGYATGMFGKWHLGHTEGRFPTDQGFDEWYGIPNSSDETAWEVLDGYKESGVEGTFIFEGKKGTTPKKVKPYNLKERALIDGELTQRSIDFMQRQVKKDKPFFLYLPYTDDALPVAIPHPGLSPARQATAALPMSWPRSTPTTACCWTQSMIWESATTRCSSSPRTTGRKRYLKDRAPHRSNILFPVQRVPGGDRCSPVSKAACECRSPLAGQAKYPPALRATRSCTRWTCSRPSPKLPAARYRATASSMVSTRPISCWANSRNPTAKG